MVRMTSPLGRSVEVSEVKAERLSTMFGWKYPDDYLSVSEPISEPVTPTPAPKKRGRPRKEV